jgi:hypothetical protein
VIAPAPSLADVARDVAVGAASPQQLHRAFLDSAVYCERGESPGFRGLGPPHAGLIGVFSSPDQLALARGAVGWFCLTGADLLELTPPGYDLLLDMAGPSPLRLRPAALARETAPPARREGAAP